MIELLILPAATLFMRPEIGPGLTVAGLGGGGIAKRVAGSMRRQLLGGGRGWRWGRGWKLADEELLERHRTKV
jgi:hypothetical protein